MKNHTLQYYMHDGPSAFRFELSGHLNDDGARRLEQDWRTAAPVVRGRTLIVDMTFVTGVDERGRELFRRWHSESAEFVAKSKASRELAESIIGKPLPDPAPAADTFAHSTWLPFRTSFVTPALSIALLAAMLFPAPVHAANLKAETVAAWDGYLGSVNAVMQDRVRPGGSFLWADESPERIAKLHSREITADDRYKEF